MGIIDDKSLNVSDGDVEKHEISSLKIDILQTLS